jgi:hypothetical protein
VPNFTYVAADRSSGVLPTVASYQDFTADGAIYSQYLAGLVPKLDLSVFDSFADTAGSFVINKAEIVLGNVQTSSSALKPPSVFGLYLTDDSNLAKGIVSSLADQSSPLGFNYNRTNNDYLGDGFYYFSQLKDGRIDYNNALVYSSSSNVDQFKVNAEDIKLRIYYTKMK